MIAAHGAVGAMRDEARVIESLCQAISRIPGVADINDGSASACDILQIENAAAALEAALMKASETTADETQIVLSNEINRFISRKADILGRFEQITNQDVEAHRRAAGLRATPPQWPVEIERLCTSHLWYAHVRGLLSKSSHRSKL